jgi:hypothetical protein
MVVAVFILVYLVSFAINLIICYQDNKRHIFNIGNLIDNIEFYMWCPILNTLFLIIIIVCKVIMKIWTLSKLGILWEKFRNIKLK